MSNSDSIGNIAVTQCYIENSPAQYLLQNPLEVYTTLLTSTQGLIALIVFFVLLMIGGGLRVYYQKKHMIHKQTPFDFQNKTEALSIELHTE